MMISFSPFWSQSALTVRFVVNTRDLIQDLLLASHWRKNLMTLFAMDLKPYKGVHSLHLIDLATRCSNAVMIHSKGKEVIVKTSCFIGQKFLELPCNFRRIMMVNSTTVTSKTWLKICNYGCWISMVQWSRAWSVIMLSLETRLIRLLLMQIVLWLQFQSVSFWAQL